MEIGDKLEFELVKAESPGSCSGCDIRCGDGIFKLIPKQNHITFKNVSSDIGKNDKGEPAQINLTMPIKTKEDLELAYRLWKKDGVITVEIYLDKEEN